MSSEEVLSSAPSGTAPEPPPLRSVERRWGPVLGKKFCAVSSVFLQHYHELRPHPGARGLTSTEAMLIVQLYDFKWDEKAPYPTVAKLATRMGLSQRMVRTALKSLEDSKYIRREPSQITGPNRYHFDGLIAALEQFVANKAEQAA